MPNPIKQAQLIECGQNLVSISAHILALKNEAQKLKEMIANGNIDFSQIDDFSNSPLGYINDVNLLNQAIDTISSFDMKQIFQIIKA